MTDISITWQSDGTVSAPTINPASQKFSKAFTATISAEEGASVYYTTNGDDPTATTGTPYTEAGVSIPAGKTVTLKAIAVKDSKSSEVSSATYTYFVPAPTFDKQSQQFNGTLNVTMTRPEGATGILYTTDGTEPDENNNEAKLESEKTVTLILTKTTTLRAVAVDDDFNKSEETSATYTYFVPAPTFDKQSQQFRGTIDVTVTLPEGAAGIYYTTDGTDPTGEGGTEELETKDFTLTFDKTTTLKAIAVDNSDIKSEMTSATYTLTASAGNNDFDGTVIWSEDFSSNDFKNENATYSTTNTGSILKDENYAGCTTPEILLKGNDTFTVNIKSLKNKFGDLVLSFYTNKEKYNVTSTTKGVAVTQSFIKLVDSSGGKKYLAVFSVNVPEFTQTLDLKFKYGSSNSRIDNMMLAAKGKFSVTGAGYATYYTDKVFVMPDGVTGQTITAVNGKALTISDSYTSGFRVSANTALLLKGDEGEYPYSIVLPNATLKAAPADNMLHGTLTDAETDYTETGKTFLYYKLSYNKAGDKLGFYWDQPEGAAFTNGANKAYLAVPRATTGTTAISGFAFDDMVSGINTAATAGNDGTKRSVYDLSGRRVQAGAARSGLYIVNGKKVMVK